MRRGPLPKSDEDRQRRNAPTVEFTELGREPVVAAEKLGRRPGGGRWEPEALAYWRAFSTSPQSTLFGPTDWRSLKRLVTLVDLFYREPSSALAGEIRQMEGKFGATIDDRMRLRLRLHRPEAPSVPVESPAAAAEPALRRVAGDPRLALVQKRQADA